MLAFYSVFPEKYRFSRGVILFGGITALAFMIAFRWVLLKWKVVEHDDEVNRHQQTLIVGTPAEFAAVQKLMHRIGLHKRIMGRVAPGGDKEGAIFQLSQLPDVLDNIRVREVIFCEGYLSFASIINLLQQLPHGINVRFHSHGTQSIVGSDSKDSSGEAVAIDSFELNQPYQRRVKRLVDLALAFSILITFPIHLVLCGGRIIYNATLVLLGKKTWVSYSNHTALLPQLRPGVLATDGHAVNHTSPLKNESLLKIDEWYARNYHWLQDVKLVAKHYKRLGNTG
jgi:hypothetical protein